MGMPAPPRTSQGAQQRARDPGPGSSTGLTPEAKRTKPFNEAVKASLTLHVREKDGSALTEERYLSLKSSFAYYVEDMMSKGKDPPICGGRWSHSRSVVRIPMAGEEDLLWMRCFLDKAYLVQSDEEFNRSKGKAIHLVMDEKAEEIFVRSGCTIPFAGAGWVSFEDRASYVARIKAQERQRMQPKPSELQKGLLAQEISVERMNVDDDEVIEVGRTTRGEPEKSAVREKTVADTTDKELAKSLQAEVRQGRLGKEAAKVKFLEQTGLDMDAVVPRRTTSGSSWTEEVEMAKELEIPESVSEEHRGGADDDDHARFELQQEQQAQVHHRAAGSDGVGAGGASGSL